MRGKSFPFAIVVFMLLVFPRGSFAAQSSGGGFTLQSSISSAPGVVTGNGFTAQLSADAVSSSISGSGFNSISGVLQISAPSSAPVAAPPAPVSRPSGGGGGIFLGLPPAGLTFPTASTATVPTLVIAPTPLVLETPQTAPPALISAPPPTSTPLVRIVRTPAPPLAVSVPPVLPSVLAARPAALFDVKLVVGARQTPARFSAVRPFFVHVFNQLSSFLGRMRFWK